MAWLTKEELAKDFAISMEKAFLFGIHVPWYRRVWRFFFKPKHRGYWLDDGRWIPPGRME